MCEAAAAGGPAPSPAREPSPSERAADRLAFALSAASSPFVVIFACALWVIARYSRSLPEFALLSLPFVGLVLLPPVLNIVVGVRAGRITDVHVMLREQRAEPFGVATLGAVALTAVWLALRAPHALTALAVNLVANGLLFAALTRRSKVSIHAAAFSAAVLIVSALIDGRLLAAYAGLPLVVWARVRRGRHTVGQAVGAAVLAAAVTWCVLAVMQAT